MLITDWPVVMMIVTLMTTTCIFVNSMIFKLFPIDYDSKHRNSSIDGLRGILAVFVFIHHFIVWYFYIKTGHWDIFNSNIYKSLGHTSVTIFFMITGFLFFRKITRGNDVEWSKLFKSRVRRIFPLYLAVVTIVFIIVAFKTDFKLKVSDSDLALQLLQWLLFTFPSAENINGYGATSFIVAGVTWSLVYEWFFYLSLPLIALLAGKRVNYTWLCTSIIAVMIFIISDQKKFM